ncbi:MAG: SDR family oxidoreductase [Pseudomonadota bacterium]
MKIRFDGKVAIVTGAGNGIGRKHALELARRGAKVLVNDYGGQRDGTGASVSASEVVVAEIKQDGGEALANGADVSQYEECLEMVGQAKQQWGRVDILINNAGILRDRSFGKMEPEDWNSVIDVHLNGSAYCSMAVWNLMKEQQCGRILMTTSSSGIYGNFGQSNYGAAKMGVVGLMNTLAIEGAKNGIKINCIAPTAATRMTADILSPDMLARLKPEYVTPAALYLVSEDCPNRQVIFAGAGHYSALEIRESIGAHLRQQERTIEGIAAHFEAITNIEDADIFKNGSEHVMKILKAETISSKAAGTHEENE